jgi:hypothetical protein
VLTPDPKRSGHGAAELHRDELGLSYYSSEKLIWHRLIAEQVNIGFANQTAVLGKLPRPMRQVWSELKTARFAIVLTWMAIRA